MGGEGGGGAIVRGLGRWAFQAVLIIMSPRPTELSAENATRLQQVTTREGRGGGGGPKHRRGKGWGRGRARVPGLGRRAFQAVLIIMSPRPTTQHHRTQRGKCYSFTTSHNTGGEGGGP